LRKERENDVCFRRKKKVKRTRKRGREVVFFPWKEKGEGGVSPRKANFEKGGGGREKKKTLFPQEELFDRQTFPKEGKPWCVTRECERGPSFVGQKKGGFLATAGKRGISSNLGLKPSEKKGALSLRRGPPVCLSENPEKKRDLLLFEVLRKGRDGLPPLSGRKGGVSSHF